MKKLSCLFLSVILFTLASAQKKTYDSLAIRILDRMSTIIGDLSPVQVDGKSMYEVTQVEEGGK